MVQQINKHLVPVTCADQAYAEHVLHSAPVQYLHNFVQAAYLRATKQQESSAISLATPGLVWHFIFNTLLFVMNPVMKDSALTAATA